MGEAQRISREKCQADSPAIASYRLQHTCGTLPGNSGAPLLTLPGHEDRLFIAAFSPDGARIVTYSGDGSARISESESG